jgi:hypothetical protein
LVTGWAQRYAELEASRARLITELDTTRFRIEDELRWITRAGDVGHWLLTVAV